MNKENPVVNARWINTSELSVNNSVNYIRFTKNKKDNKVRMTIGKKLKDFATSKDLSFLQFGFDEDTNSLILRLNKEEEGFNLLNNKGKHKNFLFVGNIINFVKVRINKEIPLAQRLQLKLIDNEKHIYEVIIPEIIDTKDTKDTKATVKAKSTKSTESSKGAKTTKATKATKATDEAKSTKKTKSTTDEKSTKK